ncbi:MAG: hypothetical protein V4721_12480 [Bacteroidota bacterium]
MDTVTFMTNVALALDNPDLECEQWIFLGIKKGEDKLTVLHSPDTSPGMMEIYKSIGGILGSVHKLSESGEIIILKQKP